jgi:uncharacterized protein (TIGR02284 family)
MASYQDPDTLDRLIAVCRDAESFYGYAADQVAGSQLHPLLSAAAGLHRETGEALQPHRDSSGERPVAGTFAGRLRHLRGGLKVRLAKDPETALLPELQDAEAAVVRACERALGGAIDPAARTVVARRCSIFRATQDRIAAIAERAAAA